MSFWALIQHWRVPLLMVAGALLLVVLGVAVDGRSTGGAPPIDLEARYINFVREQIPGASDRTDAQLIDAGHQVCAQLDGIESIDELGTVTAILGYDIDETGMLVVASVNSFCPEHRDLID